MHTEKLDQALDEAAEAIPETVLRTFEYWQHKHP